MSRVRDIMTTDRAPRALEAPLEDGMIQSPELTGLASPPNVAPRGVIVATDGSQDSDGAVRVGVALSRRDNVPMTLLSVVEPLPVYDADGITAFEVDRLTSITRESREAALRAQHDRTHPGIREWPYTVEVGERVSTILASADRDAASLVITGLGAHGVTARIFRRETALRLIRASTVPVLAVPTYGWGVPHSALVALDFTRSSEDAARAALDLLGGEGTLYLAHVTPRVPIPQGDSRPWKEVMASGILPRLETVARRLDPPPGVQVEYVTLHGEPANELLAFADQFKVDLVAAGAHGRSALGRLVLGSVSSKLVRTAQCWVLVAPPHNEQIRAARRIGTA